MRRASVLSTILVAALCVAACERKPPAAGVSAAVESPADDGYLASPSVTGSALEDGALVLTGEAEPGARVRLASPAGEAVHATADARGRWRIAMPPLPRPAVFGLSMTVGGRQIQSQGYVLADTDGEATLLRAGAGAIRVDAGLEPRIATFDYDREGGAVVSGVAPPEETVTVRGDGVALGEGRADKDGRFSIPITRPLALGRHRIQIQGEGFASQATVEMTAQEAPAEAPFRSGRTPLGLRADWMTPGGGVQTTLIMN